MSPTAGSESDWNEQAARLLGAVRHRISGPLQRLANLLFVERRRADLDPRSAVLLDRIDAEVAVREDGSAQARITVGAVKAS